MKPTDRELGGILNDIFLELQLLWNVHPSCTQMVALEFVRQALIDRTAPSTEEIERLLMEIRDRRKRPN